MDSSHVPKVALPELGELVAQANTGKGSNGIESSETRADKSTMKQSRIRKCVEQLIREAESTGQGTQDVEGIYPEELSGEAASQDMIAKTDADKGDGTSDHGLLLSCTPAVVDREAGGAVAY